jgi:transposase
MTVGLGQPPRLRSVKAGDLATLASELRQAKRKFGLPEDARVVSCYEAGRDGFWLHRALLASGVENHVVDSSSIEVNRRQRRAKNDRLDAIKLAEMLVRYELGERRVWSVVQPPSPEQEAARQLHRKIEVLQHERRMLANRIGGVLTNMGVRVTVNRHFATRLSEARQWNGEPLPASLIERLLLEFERWKLAHAQLLGAERRLRQAVREETEQSPAAQRLLSLRGLGRKGVWLLLREGLVWRNFQDRRQVAAFVGLTPTPHCSGDLDRERGISKAGNARLRKLLIELSWGWTRHQPFSELAMWYQRRFGMGNRRSRKVGIVALARKLLVALWRLAVHGVAPPGVEQVDWRSKFVKQPKPSHASASRAVAMA